jgi:hypothetical protein
MHDPRPLPEASDRHVVRRFWLHVEKTEGCWVWTGGASNRGYGVFHPTSTSSCSAHRFSFVTRNGEPPPDRPLVLHSCDNPPCVRPSHLHAGTYADNVYEAIDRGRITPIRGEDHASAVLTDEIVREIIRLHAEGAGYGRIARHLGISKGITQRVLTGRSWNHITGLPPRSATPGRCLPRYDSPVPTERGELTPLQRRDLLVKRAAGFPYGFLARWFNVSRDHVRDVTRGRR